MIVEPNKYPIFLLTPFFTVIFLGIIFTPWQINELDLLQTGSGFDTSQIKGWMTPNDVAKESGIALTKLYEISHIPYTIDPNTPLKEIKYIVPDFETDMVRVAIDNYLISGEPVFKCPYGIQDDPYPGLCGFYTDNDGNRDCDYALSEFN